MTEDSATDGEVSAKHRIVAGVALVAALAGAGITALDTPWHFGGNAQRRLAAPSSSAPMRVAAADRKPGRPAPPPMAPTPARASADAAPRLHHPQRPRAAATTKARSARRIATIDEQYQAATALRCAPGLPGFFCREAIRWRLCDGHWSGRTAPGADRCRVAREEMAAR